MLWFTAFMQMFSYSSRPAASLLLDGSLTVIFSFTYRMRSFSSGEPRFGKGRPITTTARAKLSEKFNPSESFAPTTAKSRAPCLLSWTGCLVSDAVAIALVDSPEIGLKLHSRAGRFPSPTSVGARRTSNGVFHANEGLYTTPFDK